MDGTNGAKKTPRGGTATWGEILFNGFSLLP